MHLDTKALVWSKAVRRCEESGVKKTIRFNWHVLLDTVNPVRLKEQNNKVDDSK